ncbi:MAM domain-containing glycosylphosphatidylinositol anchor protein 1 isoform X2 [Xenopus laevis]|uniref:MAM domain-containing glycosylphosphatidylinositol anchor protein 1 isoform X2 n=1 Tax=Xenopus laevis TaxID=8355 RepID=A0A8J0VE63_XENLA|nr:MAM domain-containing glycosylphosphatidylinositol anchor protein 1 isoform X2 [Xenopus laevis]
MEVLWLFLFSLIPRSSRGQGVYAPAQAQIIHAGQACVVKEDNISERVYTIREGDILVLQCLVTGHPRPQVRWTKTAGSASEKFQETSIYNETLRIEKVQRMQGGRYYCKAENGVGVPAIKSIRVDVQYLDEPILTIHQTISDVRGSFYQEKTVFLRCTVSSNPPARFIWKRGSEILSHNQDNGVDIYEPLYTQGETKVLKLKNLRPKDYANYTCQVSVRDVCGIPDKSITFCLTNRTAPPALKLSVNETLVVNPGDNVTMQCSLTGGDPPPKVVWSHNQNVMPSKGGNLTIWNIRPENSGYYNCTTTNNVGNPAKKTVNLLVRSMKNATFQITPDVNKESENIQLGRDLKLSCHVDAIPQEKVVYSWFKNQRTVVPSRRRLEISRNDPDLPPDTSSLDFFDLRFSDYGTYMCVASFPGTPTPELSIEVNISAETVPPTLTVPKGQSIITVREGSRAELQCDVRGKPKPPILWTRVDKEGPLPTGEMIAETYDGKLRLENVTREISGTYKCQTARYNGFNIRPREATVQLNVQFAPVVEPKLQEIRQSMHSSFTMRCNLLKGSPLKLATAVWRYNRNLLNVSPNEQQEYSELRINSLTQKTSGTYECIVSNDVGSDSCVFQVTGKALSPEFYYDTPSPIKVFKQFRNYSYLLQWTQKEPGAVDPITSYKLEYRQTTLRNIMSKDIPVRGIQKGLLQQYLLTDLKANQSYEVQLTPYTSFGAGDSASRIIRYTEPNSPNPSDNTCRFDNEKICGFVQDRRDNFDWTRQSMLTENPKRTPNTGPVMDRSNTPEGYYMFIEASPPRVPGEKARLISPMYNMSTRPPYHRTPFCISFYYHMYGRHIGNLNLLMRARNKGTMDTQVWSLRGDRGNRWQHAMVPMNPTGPFQVVFEGVRGSGIEGDIAIDDVTVRKGDCPWKQLSPTKDVIPPGSPACKVFSMALHWALAFFLFVLLR